MGQVPQMIEPSEGGLTTPSLVNPILSFKEMPAPSAGIFDFPTGWVRVNSDWMSFIIERLIILINDGAWQGDETEKYRATQEIERFLSELAQTRESIVDIRIAGVMLQKTFDGINWIDVGAVGIASIDVNTSEAGTNASSSYNSTTGALTLTLPRGDVGAEFALDEPALNPDVSDETRRCAVAVGLSTWLFEKYNDTIDQFEAAADTVSAMDSVIAIFPPGYVVADLILDALNEIAEFGSSLARTYDTVERRDAHAEWLFCHLQENGALSELVWNDYIQWVTDEGASVPSYVAYLAYIEFLKFDAVRARASKESYGSGNCVDFGCNTWSQQWVFAGNGMSPWTPVNAALYPSGNGDLGAYNFATDEFDSVLRRLGLSDYRDISMMELNFDARVLTRIEMSGYGSTPSGATAQFTTEVYHMGVRLWGQTSLGGPSGGVDIPDLLADKVTLRISYAKTTSFVGGNGHITGAKLYGEGSNPF